MVAQGYFSVNYAYSQGCDVTGIVEAVGCEVKGFMIDDRGSPNS